MRTELGRIAELIATQPVESTPLQKQLSELGFKLLLVCLGLVAVIFLMQLVRGGNLVEVFFTSISLAVAAIPEGLPAVVTLVLAAGVRRMVRRQALIRKLSSVETLGCVTDICSDKTGTLTRNEMMVERIFTGEDALTVTGTGYAPEGEFHLDERAIEPQCFPDLLAALEAGAYCNRAQLVATDDNSRWQVLGDPTEGAVLVAARKAGVPPQLAAPVVHENPFDAERKMMSVIVQIDDEHSIMYCKGAPEVVLAKCVTEQFQGVSRGLSAPRRALLLEQAESMAGDALRVLAVARKPTAGAWADEPETGLEFLGLLGMKDPPRTEAREAVWRCFLAGIRPVMISGDHPATALAIARELGIARQDDDVVSGSELDKLSDDELAARVEQVRMFARVPAEHKLRIVTALRSKQRVVAMTGDGVNDAAAVKRADIGIAMGITGTDVTKEAADMVLLDDNFASIVNAVEEGRAIYDNIQKFIHYLLSTNAGELMLLFVASLAGWPLPLTAIQILWINLVTDGLPALRAGHGAAGARHHGPVAAAGRQTDHHRQTWRRHFTSRNPHRRSQRRRVHAGKQNGGCHARPCPHCDILHRRALAAFLFHWLPQRTPHDAATRAVLKSTTVARHRRFSAVANRHGNASRRTPYLRCRRIAAMGLVARRGTLAGPGHDCGIGKAGQVPIFPAA